MDQYFIVENDQKKGPFSMDDLVRMNIPETVLVWKKGLQNWVILKELPEYLESFPPPIPKNIEDKKENFHDQANQNHESPLQYTELTNQSIEESKTTSSEIKNDIENPREPSENKLQELNATGSSSKFLKQKESKLPIISKVENFETSVQLSFYNDLSFTNAGFFLRLYAFLIDFLISFFLTSFVWTFFNLPLPDHSTYFSVSNYAIFKNPYGLLFAFLYYSLFEGSRLQATPGKLIIGLCVTDLYYGRIFFGQAAGRTIGKFLSGLILGIGYILIGFTKNKQGLHDLLAHTYVIKSPNKEKKGRRIAWILFHVAFLAFISTFIINYYQYSRSNELSSISSNSDFESKSVNNQGKVLTFSSDGISFEYPSNFELSKNNIKPDTIFQVNCFNNKHGNYYIFNLTCFKVDADLKKMILFMADHIKKRENVLSFTSSPIFKTNYKGNESLISNFEEISSNVKYYGVLIAFKAKSKSILLFKQARSVEELDTKFKIIENSLEIN